jgi:hypothetical protein
MTGVVWRATAARGEHTVCYDTLWMLLSAGWYVGCHVSSSCRCGAYFEPAVCAGW